MKKFLSIILVLTAALCLAACSRDREAFFAGVVISSSQDASVAAVSPSAESEPEEESTPDDRLFSETAADQLRSGTYYIDCTSIIEVEGLRLENTMAVAVDKGDSAVKTTSQMSGALTTMRIINLKGDTWLVNDTNKTCVKVDPAEMSGGFDTDFSYLTFEERGESSFDGTTLRYEQYDQQGDTVRFFLDQNDRICGLTRTIEDEQLAEMTLRINAISHNIPAKTIALPEGYSITQ